jgi:hypothetical protein
VTIPQAVRERAGLMPGTDVEIEIAINPIIYAEFASGFTTIADLEARSASTPSEGSPCPTRRASWPAARSSSIAGAAGCGPRPRPTSTSAPPR